jgi:hypothetical protein
MSARLQQVLPLVYQSGGPEETKNSAGNNPYQIAAGAILITVN